MLRLRRNRPGNPTDGDRGGSEQAVGDNVVDFEFFPVQGTGALAGGPFGEGGLAADADFGPAGDFAGIQNFGGEAADLAVGAGEVGFELDRCGGGRLVEQRIAGGRRTVGGGDGGRGWVTDPAGSGGGRIYPLKELGVPVEALRYYRRIPSPA